MRTAFWNGFDGLIGKIRIGIAISGYYYIDA